MADWVRCTCTNDDTLWINLERVVALKPTSVGTEITYHGDNGTFIVRERPSAILGNNKVRDA
ncbi:hypothetical protein SPDO_05260 [Sphingomonas dokdonensis]|uniref:Uncharacterized protein n=1 Tax=Sphingomonas dokdonensis TaxID=344880 RepID=A0A245ZV85_9SPHN|nr:hypothetical protein SPDO_05260 [Sphingomonas dokdonensis]